MAHPQSTVDSDASELNITGRGLCTHAALWCTGIWQTVWLEPVPKARIERLQLIPDIDASQLNITVHGNEPALGRRCRAEAFDAQQQSVASAEGVVGEKFSLSIESPQLWSFETPYLYGIEINIIDDSSSGEISKPRWNELTGSPAIYSNTLSLFECALGTSVDCLDILSIM